VFFKGVGCNKFLNPYLCLILPNGKEFCDKIKMTPLQKQILYKNNGETKDEARVAKAELREKLLGKMCYWAENVFRLDNRFDSEYVHQSVRIIGKLPNAIHPSVFEKREFRDIVNEHLDDTYDENRKLCASSNQIALSLLSLFYW